MAARLGELRYEPTAKRIRAQLGSATVVDSTRALLVWEPRRIVPSYAVPEGDIGVALVDVDPAAHPEAPPDRPVLDPSVPFAAHTAEGTPVDVAGARPGAGFRLADPDLAGYLVLDFTAFDGWYEEDEPSVAHPRDPFHRIDVLASSRTVRVERDGTVLAESARPTLLFETSLPTRYYLPRDDVRVELVPSSRQSYCAYKGQASYWSVSVDGLAVPDLAWSYEDPRHEAQQVRGLVAFFNEHVDLVVDGERQDRPSTPWS
jgi:uncharacterized protein (DUF427 family)